MGLLLSVSLGAVVLRLLWFCGLRWLGTRPSGRPGGTAFRRCVLRWVGMAAVRSRQGFAYAAGRKHVHPDGSCSGAGRGRVRCQARTCPSGRRLMGFGS